MPVLLPWAQNDRWERLLIDCIWESLQRWQSVSSDSSILSSLAELHPRHHMPQKGAPHFNIIRPILCRGLGSTGVFAGEAIQVVT